MTQKVDPSVTLGPLTGGVEHPNDTERSSYWDKNLADRKAKARELGGSAAEVCDPYAVAKGVGSISGLSTKENLDKWADYAKTGPGKKG